MCTEIPHSPDDLAPTVWTWGTGLHPENFSSVHLLQSHACLATLQV